MPPQRDRDNSERRDQPEHVLDSISRSMAATNCTLGQIGRDLCAMTSKLEELACRVGKIEKVLTEYASPEQLALIEAELKENSAKLALANTEPQPNPPPPA